MFGIDTPFSRLKRMRRGEATEMVDVFISPSRPHWNYVPVGPFRLVHIDVDPDEGAIYALETHDQIASALLSFADRHRPTPGQTCGIIDDNDQIVVLWGDCHDTDDEYSYEWFGCRLAFHCLSLMEIEEGWAVRVALWEQQARRFLGGAT